jgi:Na+/H+ antiporter NhaD/arsenite permease-like protein
MVMTALLEREGFFGIVIELLTYECNSGSNLLIRVCVASAALAALITNDTTCVFLTPIVARICKKFNLPYTPFLLALGTSANIGSSATPVGNPQNMIIASFSGIPYSTFLRSIGVSALMCVVLNTLALLVAYRGSLVGPLEVFVEEAIEAPLCAHTLPPAPPAPDTPLPGHLALQKECAEAVLISVAEALTPEAPEGAARPPAAVRGAGPAENASRSRAGWRLRAFSAVLACVSVCFVAGLPLGWTAVTGCVCMLSIDLREPDAVFKEVDIGLLVFFASLFVVVAGFQHTGIPTAVWNQITSSNNGGALGLATARGVALYTLVVTVGSNTVSNVPLVLILAPALAKQAEPDRTKGWLLLAFVSTVAGNLTLMGSVANLIVTERAKDYHRMGFFEFTKFGFPNTIIQAIVGVALLVAVL